MHSATTRMIDVILTSYNRPRMIKKAIDSVLKQTGADFKLYIMDDNSNDETKQVILDYVTDREDHKVICYFSSVKPEGRTAKARYAVMINKALEMSDGDYITYLTDDCWYLPGRLEAMSSYLDSHPDVACCYGNQLIVNPPPWYRVNMRGNYGPVMDPRERIDHNSVMHRRTVLDAVGMWDEELSPNPNDAVSKDGIFFTRIAEQCGPIMPVGVTTDCFRFHEKMYTSLVRSGKLADAATMIME